MPNRECSVGAVRRVLGRDDCLGRRPNPTTGNHADNHGAPGAIRRYHHCGRRKFPLPTTKEWGEGQGEGRRRVACLNSRRLRAKSEA